MCISYPGNLAYAFPMPYNEPFISQQIIITANLHPILVIGEMEKLPRRDISRWGTDPRGPLFNPDSRAGGS